MGQEIRWKDRGEGGRTEGKGEGQRGRGKDRGEGKRGRKELGKVEKEKGKD